jgi:ankyrin repeat protein
VAQDKAIADCRSALFLTDPEVDRATLITAKGNRVPGTCEWIKDEAQYRQWLEGDITLLWICGGPGRGKTMLSVFLVEELKKNQPVMYYFCINEDARRNNAAAVLRSLLWQITRIHPELAYHFLAHLGAGEFDAARRIEASLSSVETLWITFVTICRDPKVAKLGFIIDGLDECDEKSRDWLASRFYHVQKESVIQNSHPPKIVIISRDIPRLRTCSTLRLDPDHDGDIGKDVRRFVSARVKELWALDGLDKLHRQQVESTLLARSEGMFLWVGFAMAELRTKRTVLEVEQCLRDMPAGLPAFYGRMLRQIDTNRTEDIAKILRWTALSAGPLSLSELAEATHCKATSLLSAEDVVRDLVVLCHPFLVIQSISGSQNPDDAEHLPVGLEKITSQRAQAINEQQTVNLIHHSARDFMDSREMPTVFQFQRDQTHLEMAWRCMDLIQESAKEFTASHRMSLAFRFQRQKIHSRMGRRLDQLDPRHGNTPSENPLLRYAITNWPSHAQKASSLAQSLMKHKSGFFDESSIVRSWWYHQEIERHPYLDRPDVFDSVSLSAYIGFVPWIEKVLTGGWSRKPAVNRRAGHGLITPLEHAADRGHRAAMETLFEHGATANWCGRKDRSGKLSPIQWFAASGNEMAVRICIDHGTYLGPDGQFNDTPLRLAAESGHHTVVQLLLAAGAHCDETCHQKTTALMCAASGGHGAVVQVLLDHEARTENRNGRSALELAAAGGHNHIITMFLDHGAPIGNRMALWLAASQGNEVEVGLLLDRGVAVDLRIPKAMTALYCAAIEGHNKVVRVLLDRGANIEAIAMASDLAGRKSMMHVITSLYKREERFERLVKLCCSAGVDINAVDNVGCTALHLAVSHGTRWDVDFKQTTRQVQALVDHGANVNAEDKLGLTPLHQACRVTFVEDVIRVLLDNGAQANARDHRGRTPLYLAAGNMSMDIGPAQLLLDHGADLNVCDNEGLALLSYARSRSVVELLKQLGAVKGRRK